MKLMIGLAFLAILVSLGSACFFLLTNKGKYSRTVNALSVRIGLSIALFLVILLAGYMGWIEPHGLIQ